MITMLGIENFLSYQKQPPIALGRLNVFIGKNSSGKSTILHALALLSETVDDPSPQTSLLFSGNGLNLGTYRDVVHRNNRRSSIAFDLTISIPDTESIPSPMQRRDAPVPFRYRLTFHEDEKSLQPYVSAVSAYFKDSRLFTLQGSPARTAPGYIPAGVRGYARRPPGFVPALHHFLPIFRYEGRRSSPRDNSRAAPFWSVNIVSREFANMLSDLVYIGPSRSALDTVYFPFGRFPKKLNSTGSNAVPLILGSVRKTRERRRFERTLELWLAREFSLVSKSSLKHLSGGQGVRLEGVDPLIRAAVTLSNTGYGVSQILPIVIQLAVGKPGVLLIEQPEIHLHPSAQAQLANLLLAFAAEGYQLFVETHSEHLIYRLRGMLARGESPIPNDEVRLFVVEKGRSGSRIRRVDVSSTGKLSGWPEGFFSASSQDIISLLKAGGE